MNTRLIFFSFLFLVSIATRAQSSQSKPLTIGSTETFNSSFLKEPRSFNVYLPVGYNPKDTVTYPVVYVLDGGLDEDFLHIAGIYQFNSFEWINLVPKSIVVGIVNTARRRDMTFPVSNKEAYKRFEPLGGSEAFMNYIEKEVIPFVGSHYKTNSYKTIVGQSLAGLFATEVLLKRPTLFNEYIIVSPSIWWNDGSLLNESIEAFSKANQLKIYIGVGKEGLAPIKEPHVMEVDANLLVEKLKAAKNPTHMIVFDYLPNETHATVTHQAVFNALRLLHCE